MAIAWVECWKCEICGHRWIRVAGSDAPRLCAKCRKTKWHTKAGAMVQGTPASEAPRVIPAVATEVDVSEGSIPSPAPNMQALRAICAGKIPTNAEIDAEMARRSAYPVAIAEVPICGKTWWEDGEQWECLMDKGHKESKHGMRGMFRRVEA